ncbi:hypothetical protein ABPG73_012538 [Tetrahymena malaccensis]
MARLLCFDSFKIQNNAQFFWGPLAIQRSIKSDIKNLQKLIRRFYFNQIFCLKKEWQTLQSESSKQNYNFTQEEDLKQLFHSQFEENQTQLKLNLENCSFVGQEYDNTQFFQQSPDFINKQKKILEISLKIQHLIQFLSETKEEECDRNKNLRNGIWDYANTVYELLDKQTEDIQQSCILLASDRSSMTHFDATALGVALFYYVNLQPSPTGQFYYGITNLPKITYISFKKSWDGLTEDVLNWNPVSNISVNPSVQTIIITESQFDYAPYNFNYLSYGQQQNNSRPNTYKICLDQIELQKYNQEAQKSQQNKIKSDDVVYIFEKIIYPLVRVHKPNVIVMNHNFSYTSENGPLKPSSQNLDSSLEYNLKPTDFASILQTLGTICSQKILLVSNNKLTDFQSEFAAFQKNQEIIDAIEQQKLDNLEFQQDQSLPKKKRQIEQGPSNIQIPSITPNYHTQILNVSNPQKPKKIQKANQKLLQKQLGQDQTDAKNDDIIIIDNDKNYFPPKSYNYQKDLQISKNVLINKSSYLPSLASTSLQTSCNAATGSFQQQNDSTNQYKQLNNQQHLSFVKQPTYFQSYSQDINHNQINSKYLHINQQQQSMPITYAPSQTNNLNSFQELSMNKLIEGNQQMRQVSQFQQIQSYLPAQPNQSKIFYQIDPYIFEMKNSNINQKNQIRQMQSVSNEKYRQIQINNQQQDFPSEIKNEQFINNVSKYYQKILQKPIINSSGKLVCFFIQKYIDLDTQKLQKEIQEINQIILQEKLIEESQPQSKCESNQLEPQQQVVSTQNNNQSQTINTKQDKETANNQRLTKLNILQTQLELIQDKKKLLLKNIKDIFSQNKWRLSNFVFNWQIVVKLIKDEDEIEKYLLSHVSIENIQGSVEEIFKLDQTVDKSQLKIAAIIFSLYKQQQSQRDQEISNLIQKKELYERKFSQNAQNAASYRFYKKYTEYVLQTLIQTLYSNAEISDVFSNSYKNNYNYLNSVNPNFQLYIQEINKRLILEKEQNIRQYFLEENMSIPELSNIIKESETRYIQADQNTNFLHNFSDNQQQQNQIADEVFMQEPETSQLRYSKVVKPGVVKMPIAREDAKNQNKETLSNQNVKSSSQIEKMEEEQVEKKKVEEIEAKFLKNFKNINQKCSKESLKFKISTEIKGLKHITNLKAQSQNQFSNPSLLQNLQSFNSTFNQTNKSQQAQLSTSDNNQHKTAQIRVLNGQTGYQSNIKILNNLCVYSNQMSQQNNSNKQNALSNSNPTQQQNNSQNLIRNDIRLQESLSTKKVLAKKYKCEIFDIRQQKIVKLKTSQRLVLYDEDCQIQVIYLPQNTLEIYLFNLKIQNNYNHVVLTQPYPNSEIFDAKYIPVQQQDLRFSSSLCYNENFVFKVFGESTQPEKTINQIEIIDRSTKEYRLLKYNGSNSLSLQIVSQFSSSCFFSTQTQLHYISCFGGYDPERKPVTQVGLIEVNLNTFTYKIAQTLNKSDFNNEYLVFYKNRPNIGKKCHQNLQNVSQEKNQQLTTEKNVKDFWKKVPHFFSSSQSVYDEVSDSIYVFGGNANKKQSFQNFKESIIETTLSCNSFSWEEYLCIVKFQNVSRTASLKDAIFLKLEVKNMNDIIYQNNIFLNEQKIQAFEPMYGTPNFKNKQMQEIINKKAVFSTLFRHSNILSYRIPNSQNSTEGKMEIEQTSSTFVIQQSHPTHFKYEKLTCRNDQQPHQLLSMAFSLDTDPLPKIQLQVKVGCC